MSDKNLSNAADKVGDTDKKQADDDPAAAKAAEAKAIQEQRMIHTLAHCMWWVEQGVDLPKDQRQRDALWEQERFSWLRKAQLIHLHLRQNKLEIASNTEVPN